MRAHSIECFKSIGEVITDQWNFDNILCSSLKNDWFKCSKDLRMFREYVESVLNFQVYVLAREFKNI
jgi:hypothetical protein